MDIEKGEILARGITPKKYMNSRKGQKKAFSNSIFLLVLSLFIMSEFVGTDNWDFRDIGIFVIALFVLLFSLMGIWAYWPSKWGWLNTIYERGLSATDAPFLPFSEVKKIGEGKVPDRTEKQRFVIAVSKDGNWKHDIIYEEADFVNDFYEDALQLLKQKCPDVPWVQMEWLEWKKKNKNKKEEKK